MRRTPGHVIQIQNNFVSSSACVYLYIAQKTDGIVLQVKEQLNPIYENTIYILDAYNA
jgi:hypothetical protein